MKTCTVTGCANKEQARGWCNTHYWRWHQYGDALYEGPRNKAARHRNDAKRVGSTTYETGLPCLRGHIAARVSSGQCVECRKVITKEKYKNDPSRSLAASAKWIKNNKEKMARIVKDWETRNRDRKNEHRARRRALEKNAMPAWADRQAIAAIYKEARDKGLVVDHVVPLSSKVVCGLHVPANLQLLTAAQNKAKHNRFDIEAPV